MAEKNRTPDILGTVLSAPTPAAVEALAQPAAAPKRKTTRQQDGKMIRDNAGKTVRQQEVMPASSQVESSQADAEKVKATFYLAPEAVEGLEDAWLQLRRQARGTSRKRAISKSEIVEIALQILLEDLEAHGEASRISSKLFEFIPIKS
jgi:hypothetical protein